MPVPNSFANVTTSIPLSQLDANFNTPITLGNTAIQLGNTVTTLNNMTLANVTISSGNVTITNVSVTTANVTTANITTAVITTANVATANVTTSQILNYGTANGVAYLNASKALTTGTALVFDGTNFAVGVTPSAWGSGLRALQVGANSYASVFDFNNGVSSYTSNLFYTGSAYARMSASSRWSMGYFQDTTNGAHTFVTSTAAGTNVSTPTISTLATLDSAGNWGLGVTPSAWTDFTVLQNKTAAFLGYDGGQAHYTNNAFYQSGAWKYITNQVAIRYSQVSGQHQFFTAASGIAGNNITWTQAMTLDASGNLSVGTTSANARLTVNTLEAKTTSASVANFGTATGGSSDFQFLISRSASGSGAYYSLQSVEQNVAVRDIVLQPSGGNVGIGSTSVAAVLDVIQPSASANGGRVAYFRSTAAGDVANNAVIISKFDNNTTTSQIFMKFEVNNTATSCGRINANGANTAAFGSTSDRRIKENIEDLPSQLHNILALRPVEFDYIESYGGGHQIGFIAQEMQEVYPDVVSADESEEQILSITGWSKTEARLVKAIQEQQAMIDEMKAEIAALKGNA